MTDTPTASAMAERIEALMEKATKGPWQAMREGNQYVDCKKLTPTLVGASRIHGVQRPWNPYAATQFGLTPEHHEAVRFKDEDADLIVTLVNLAPHLIAALRDGERMREALEKIKAKAGSHTVNAQQSGIMSDDPGYAGIWAVASTALARTALTPPSR